MAGEFYGQHEMSHEYSFEEIIALLPYELAQAIAVHQSGDLRGHAIIAEPYPPELVQNEPQVKNLLENNRAMYDDSVEELLDRDPVLQILSLRRENATYDEQISTAFRVRRTTLVRLLLEDLAVLSAPPEDTRPGSMAS